MPRDITIEIDTQGASLREGLYDALTRAVSDSLPGPAGSAFVVDVGAGRGELLGRLSQLGVEVLGLDPEGECVAAARRHGPCVQGGAEQLAEALAGRRPDVVVCSHVLEHLEAPLDAVRRMRATGAGAVVLAVPNLHRASRLLRVLAGNRRGDHPAHLYGWGHAEFEAMLARAGLSVVGWQVDRVTVNPLSGRAGTWLTHRLRTVEERLTPRLVPSLSSSLIARCVPET
jgi:SAM-dependent methyltransferase